MADQVKKTVTIKRHKKAKTKQVDVYDSPKKGMRYFIPQGTGGYHFDKLKSLQAHFKRLYPKADDISIG